MEFEGAYTGIGVVISVIMLVLLFKEWRNM